jgi:tRNA threonylcarbamoyladenosine biosynthesis protein TsaB
MNLLLIDTSTKNFSLAVSRGEKIVCQRNVTADKILSSQIVPAIEKILIKAGVPLKSINGFAIGLGPGSFTSLRVGMAVTKALAGATAKPLVGIPSLDTLAMNAVGKNAGQICTIMDARRNLVYACHYSLLGGQLKRGSDYLLTPITEVLKNLKGQTLFLGDGLKLYRQIIEDAAVQPTSPNSFEPIFSTTKNDFPRAAKMLSLALPRFIKKDYDDVDKIVPLYLYPEDCQIRR